MSKKLYSVIIGINAYPFMPLNGCVNDAIDVADYFQHLCKSQGDLEWKPLYLLAPNGEDVGNIDELSNVDFQKPTRQNIIAAFDHFKQAQDGDFCLLYYSGHGSTVTAPAEFKGYAPGDMLQTICCVDSRIKSVPDLLDKELGYLIASALEGKEPSATQKGVHFLAFIDCCHSGTVTRSMNDEAPVSRMAVQGPPLSTIHGFDPKGNCFYAPLNGRTTVNPEGGLRHARYINISGARDSESAYEIFFEDPSGRKRKRGVFTWSVLETLRQGGVNITYGELIRRAEMSVRARVDNQIPQLGSTEMDDENLYFLRNELKTPELRYQVMFERGEWRVNAGTINGWISPDYGPASLRLDDGRIIPIVRVESTYSVLDSGSFSPDDEANLTLMATVHQMPFPEIKIGISPEMPETMRATITAAFSEHKPQYGRLAKPKEVAGLNISVLKDRSGSDCYVLTRPGSLTPLFMRTPSAQAFMGDLAKVLRYEYVLKLDNPQTELPRNSVKVDIKTLEGVSFGPDTLNSIPESSFNVVQPASLGLPYPEVVRVSAKALANGKMQQPAIKVRISPQGEPCWVGALYCDAKCAIDPGLLRVQKIGGDGESPFVDLKFNTGGKSYSAIPLTIDKDWAKVGVTEVQDYLIIFVSTRQFDLSKYQQSGIQLDITRSAGFDSDEPLQKDDWYTIKIPLQIAIPKPKQELTEGLTKSFGAFSISAPGGFSATVEAITPKDSGQKRGLTGVPPLSFWAEADTRPEVFARGVAASPDTHISIVELTNVQGTISKDAPLVITPADALEVDESILPMAYDPEHQVYYPIGYTDEQGRVCINELPAETSGSLGQEVEGQRSLGTAFKMYFQKLVWSKLTGRPNINRLSLLDESGQISSVYRGHPNNAADQAALAEIKAKVAAGPVLLMVHGIIGDLDNPLAFIQKSELTRRQFSAILTYEYENLDTPIEETAGKLLQLLRNAGVPDKSLVVLAHSMGGLVSRYMMEQLDAASLVSKLVLLGTPNGGSEVNEFRERLFGWITLGLNGISKIKPYLGLLSQLWKGIDGSVFRTLKQMDPKSEFLQQLNGGQRSSDIPYWLVAGNTSIIESSAGEDESVFKQVLTGLKERGVYILADYAIFGNEPNDMAVRVNSMQAVPGGFDRVEEVATDHISYYALTELEQILADAVK